MSDDSRQPLATGLIYEESLPLGFTVVERLPADWVIEDINNSNESFLSHCASLEEHHCAKQDIDDSMIELYHELTRLDLKMNLLLEFVAQVLNRKLTLPNRVDMRLGPQGLEWRCSRPPPRDSIVKLDLFLFPRYPRSIVLFGSVVNVNAKDDPSAVTVAFRGLSESVQDWIEKIIFRYHRRSVANRRMAHT
jgi:hypothetical protein